MQNTFITNLAKGTFRLLVQRTQTERTNVASTVSTLGERVVLHRLGADPADCIFPLGLGALSSPCGGRRLFFFDLWALGRVIFSLALRLGLASLASAASSIPAAAATAFAATLASAAGLVLGSGLGGHAEVGDVRNIEGVVKMLRLGRANATCSTSDAHCQRDRLRIKTQSRRSLTLSSRSRTSQRICP